MTIINGRCTIGSSGAVSGIVGSDLSTITKETGDGNYSITLAAHINAFLFGQVCFAASTSSGIMRAEFTSTTLKADGQSKSKLTFTCYDETDAAANPASGSVMYIQLTVRTETESGVE